MRLTAATVERLIVATDAQRLANEQALDAPDVLRTYLEARLARTVHGDFGALLAILRRHVDLVTRAELDRILADAVSAERAQAVALELDPDGAQRDLGAVTVQFVSALGIAEVRTSVDAVTEAARTSLDRLAARVAGRLEQD